MFKASYQCMINKNTKRYRLHIKRLLNVKKVRQMRQHSQRLPSGETVLTESQTLTRRQPADNWQMSGQVGSLHTLHFSYVCSSCQCLSTYMHKFSLKMTVSTCVRNSWEDTIAVPLLWKIFDVKVFFVKKCTER